MKDPLHQSDLRASWMPKFTALVANRQYARAFAGDPDYDPTYDLDGDDDIDILDILLVAVHWGEACE